MSSVIRERAKVKEQKDERRLGVHGLLLLRAGNADGQHEAPDGGGDDGEKQRA